MNKPLLLVNVVDAMVEFCFCVGVIRVTCTVWQALLERQAGRVRKASWVRPGLKVTLAIKVLPVELASLELLETRAVLVIVVLLERVDSQDLRDGKDLPEQPEALDLPAFEVPLARKARLGTKVVKDKLGMLDQVDHVVHPDLADSEEELEELDLLEKQDLLVSKVSLAHLDPLDRRELKVLPDH